MTPTPRVTAPTPPPAPTSSDRADSPALGLANAMVRGWTCAYTWRMEPVLRDMRRAEIESELWEFQHDPERGAYPAAHVIARLLIGIPDDLSWRAEHARDQRTPGRARVRAAAWTVATLVVIAGLWILPLMTASVLPPLPDRPRVVIKMPPPPGAPPPPPCAPPGYPQSHPCTLIIEAPAEAAEVSYGRASSAPPSHQNRGHR